ncbi:DUF4260 family protein [Nonomuraea sp. NPDC049419]|uniref:DUF4260 family protein n=1 Tax=Nonomuraea sp. NPDC049419 TaxID=3155772 RepID=UPI00341885AF
MGNDLPPRAGLGRRVAWGALGLFLAAFAIFESWKYGLPTTAAALAFFVLPDLVRLAGARPGGPLYEVVHRVWIPLVVVIGYSFGPVVWPPLFTAGLGWLTRIALDRTLGRGPAGAASAERSGAV